MLLTEPGRMGWDPFTEMRRLQADMNRLLEGVRTPAVTRTYPPINLWVGENSVVATAELPGFSRDDIDLTIREDTLLIRGERTPPMEDKQIVWHRRERGYGTFSRSVELPFRIDPEKVQARFRNGLLEIEMQRPETDQPRKIEITTQ